MLFIVSDASLEKILIRASMAVVLFALVLSFIFETENNDTVTARATYASVFIFVIGTSAMASRSQYILHMDFESFVFDGINI